MTDEGWEAMVKRLAVQRYDCFVCHSPRGHGCITRTGRPARLHRARRFKAAKYLREMTGEVRA